MLLAASAVGAISDSSISWGRSDYNKAAKLFCRYFPHVFLCYKLVDVAAHCKLRIAIEEKLRRGCGAKS